MKEIEMHFTSKRSTEIVQRTIPLQGSQDMIRSVTWPFSQEARQYFSVTVEAEAQEYGLIQIRESLESLVKAQAVEAASKAIFDDTNAHLTNAEHELQKIKPGRWSKATLFDLSAFACFIAEFAFTFVTLPFLLNVAPGSFLGVMLAAAPTTAMIVLDVVIARLFENPWQAIQEMKSTSRLRRVLFIGLMAGWLTVLAVANLYVVVLLADAREEASLIYQRLTDPEAEITNENGYDRQIVKKAILAVSVLVTLDGALLLLLGLNETRQCYQFSKARVTVVSLRVKRQVLQQQLLYKEAQVKVCRHNCENARERAKLAERQYKGYRHYQLEQALNALMRVCKASELVDGILLDKAKASDVKLRLSLMN
jgi:hypothetical protein